MISIDYNKQAQAFLTRNGIKFRATLSDSKVAPWDDLPKVWPGGGKVSPMDLDKPRHHYRVTLSSYYNPKGSQGLKRCQGRRLTFDFWGSIADAERGVQDVSAYDVLACISSDANCPETFEDWASDLGESTDSIRAKQTWTRCSRFAKRLRAFFTEDELEQLGEIQ